MLMLPFRPLVPGTDPAGLGSWADLASDLIADLDARGFRQGTGIGHSLGGVVTLLAAVQRPDLFSRIILLDPVVLPEPVYWMKRILPSVLLPRLIPLIRSAARRRDRWPDRTAARDRLRAKSVFARIPETAFDIMLDAMLDTAPDGSCQLRYPAAWEGRIYATVTDPWPAIRRVGVPVVAIRGAQSDTIRPATWARIGRLRPDWTRMEVPDAGHLFPLERPDEAARLIRPFLKEGN